MVNLLLSQFGRNNGTPRRIRYVLAFLCIFPCWPCWSDTISTNLGPGATYTADTAVFVQGADLAPFYQAEAREFTASADYSVTQIDIALVYISGTNAATVSLHTDNLGMPGTAIASWNLSGLPNISGISGTAAIGGAQIISGISDLSLVAGQSYFLEAEPGQSDSEMGWYGFQPGNIATFTAHSPDGPWFTEGLYDLGFSITGDPAAPAPEPSTTMLVLAGLTGVGLRAKTFRRRRFL